MPEKPRTANDRGFWAGALRAVTDGLALRANLTYSVDQTVTAAQVMPLRRGGS